MTKAFSYLRFSRPEQMRGDSLRRQRNSTRDYAKQHGLDLDESLTFRDLGVSGLHSKNFHDGALGAFIRAIENGKVRKGSYLLVESLDRLSRDKVPVAFNRFTDILARGVNIVTLFDNKTYTYESITENFGDLMLSLATMFRAHEESATKSKRVSAAWKQKRDKAQAGGKEKLTARCPAWLTLSPDRKTFIVNDDRKEVVRRIFQMAIDGHGKTAIMKRLNTEPVPSFGGKKAKGWHVAYIQQILKSESVIGSFQPMRTVIENGIKVRVPDGAPIPNYYPAIINRATFQKAQRSRQSRHIPSGRRGKTLSNLFTGLAVCGNCGAAMHYVNKGKRNGPNSYLVCSNARRAASNCKAPGWRYLQVEIAVGGCVTELDFDDLFPEIAGSKRAALDALEHNKAAMEQELVTAQKALDSITGLLIMTEKKKPLLARYESTASTVEKLLAEIAALDSQIIDESDRAKTARHDLEGAKDLVARLERAQKERGVYEYRLSIHRLLRRTIAEIQFHPSTSPMMKAVKKPKDLFGVIAVRFPGTSIGRALFARKGLISWESHRADFKGSGAPL